VDGTIYDKFGQTEQIPDVALQQRVSPAHLKTPFGRSACKRAVSKPAG
jgi:hypothetical protein